MKYQPLPIAATYRRFLALDKKLKRLLSNGKFNALSPEKQQALLLLARKLFHRLSRVLPQRRLRQALAISALVLGAGSSLQAQQFTGPEQDPFGLDATNSESDLYPFPQLVDIDADGDYDLIHRGYSDQDAELLFQENIGTAQNPAFGNRVSAPFGVDSLSIRVGTLTFGDLDGDGDIDMLAGQLGIENSDRYFSYFENTGSPTAPAFALPQADPFGLTLDEEVDVTLPYLADLDDDGDLDLLVSTYSRDTYLSNFYYFPNTGTAQNPAFGAPQLNPFGLQPGAGFYDFILPVVADFDDDGDLDIIAGGALEYLGADIRSALDYYENTGTAASAAFAPSQRNVFGLVPQINGYSAFPTAADLDGDGDVDVLTSAYTGNGSEFAFEYFENAIITSTAGQPEAMNHFKLFPAATADVINWQYGEGRRPGQLFLTLYDLAGRPLVQQMLQGEAGALSISGLPAGLYHARLTDGQGQLLGLRRVVKR